MTMRSREPFAALMLRTIFLSLLAPAAATGAAPAGTVPGELWEMTNKMSIQGSPMQMPAQTNKFCRPKGKAWDEPPASKMAQERCKMSDYKLSGDKASWKVTCSDGMSGTGEITYHPDSFEGWMTMTSDEVSMKLDLSGRKVGDCDATETTKTVARARKAGEAAERAAQAPQPDPMASACADAAAKGERSLFMGPSAMCKGADQKAAFCKQAATEAAYDRMARESSDVVADVATFCGTTASAVRDKLCGAALASESLDFLGRYCVKEAKGYAAEHCAGRKFTSIPELKVRTFCMAYAEKALAGN